MNSRFWLIYTTLLLFTSTIVAQPLPKLKEDGLKFFERGKYREALELLTRYDEQKSGDVAVSQAIGIASYHANQLPKAKQYLSAIALNTKNPDPSVLLYLGRTYHSELNFKEAIKNYKRFLSLTDEKHPERRRVVGDVKRCASGIKILTQPDLALVENLGEAVNSRFDEFAPVQSVTIDDRIYFASAREDSEGGLRNEQGLVDVKNGHYFNDIYLTDFDGGDWHTPTRLENLLINTSRHEWLLDITNEGKTLVFFRSSNQFSGDILIDTFKTQDETRSLPPNLVAPFQPENGDNALCFFNDSILIFAARRPEGFGGLDLYYTIFANGNWQAPKNLGRGVNSAFDETTPWLAKDGRTLYFSSNSTASMGGFDVFKAVFDTDSLVFMPAVNLGKPINSAEDDMFFRLTPDGMRAYFCSSRREGFGERDIYTALFKNFQREQTPSVPIAFHLWEAVKREQELTDANKPKEQKILEVKLEPLFYENDDDLLRGVNLTQLRTILNTVKQFPTLKVVLTCNSVEGEKASFDLYFSMKRVERIAKYLIDNGLRNENIVLKAVGSEYPIAQTVVNGLPNPTGEKLNRRVDIAIIDKETPPSPIRVNYNAPVVSEFMLNPVGNRLKKHDSGLTYKIQIVTTRRIFDNDILSKYGDAMIEAIGTEGVYNYSVGLFTTFEEAIKMQKDLLKNNQKEAIIVPFIDGLRISDEEAKQLNKKYVDLYNYLAAKKKP
ncbi:MAG: PD40 domain-containing protein [Saprospiraceae bacterium]|nr:PD40 domain-containing protein [Saprospiraceae bacterium]